LGDLNQPYSCTQWGNVATSGMPLITDDTGLPMFGLFHTDNLLPSAVYIDHTMTVHYKQAGHDNESTINDRIQEMLNNLYGAPILTANPEIALDNELDNDGVLNPGEGFSIIFTFTNNSFETDALDAVEALCEYLQEPLTIVEFQRKNPLEVLKEPIPLNKIERQTAVVAFSRRDVLSLKQQLSSDYSVSVIYGNLSPEVRREEARRFRDGESSVLVATDAIAMGLNLPIKTLLFAKDNKFDGLRRRELLPSEISQIAGRAGRYGMEDRGFVGALDKKSLETIRRGFNQPLSNIDLPFSVMATLEHTH